MVWALIDPSSFGDYFPDGEHVDRREVLEAYFKDQMTDEGRDKYSGRLTSFSYQVSRKFNEDLGPLQHHEMPRIYQTMKPQSSLASLIKMENALLAVDERLKGLIDGLEPGVHQFWPMRILLPSGKEYSTPYYGMVIRQFFDSFRPEQSTQGSWREKSNFSVTYMDNKKCISGLAFDKGAFGPAHFWREKHLNRPNIMMSDALLRAIEKAGLRIWRHFKATEV